MVSISIEYMVPGEPRAKREQLDQRKRREALILTKEILVEKKRSCFARRGVDSLLAWLGQLVKAGLQQKVYKPPICGIVQYQTQRKSQKSISTTTMLTQTALAIVFVTIGG